MSELETAAEGSDAFKMMFNSLVETFVSTYWSIPLYGKLLTIFLDMESPLYYRKYVVESLEKVDMLRLLGAIFNYHEGTTGTEESDVAVSRYLYPLETDVDIIFCYVNSITKESLSGKSFIMKVALHQVTMLLFTQDECAIGAFLHLQLLRRVLKEWSFNPRLIRTILTYPHVGAIVRANPWTWSVTSRVHLVKAVLAIDGSFSEQVVDTVNAECTKCL